MGIEKNGIRFLIRGLNLHKLNMQNTVTLGRQGLHVDQKTLSDLLSTKSAGEFLSSGFSEDLIKHLGAVSVDSMDASDYEGATIIHDLNLPIPQEMHGKYTCVIDGGTQEHVLNFPTSLANSINLLKMGGHLIMMTPANNFFGHGFYQFSPELFDAVLGPHNGMELQEMVACELFENETRWFRVAKPSVLGRRVLLRSHFCVLLFVIAKKVSSESIEKIEAMQSDYSAAWVDDNKAAHIHKQNNAGKHFVTILKTKVKQVIRNVFYPNRMTLDQQAFEEMTEI